MLKRAGIPFTVDREGLQRRRDLVGDALPRRAGGHAEPRLQPHLRRAVPYSSPFCGWTENRRYFDWVADTSTCATTSSSTPRCARWSGTRRRVSGRSRSTVRRAARPALQRRRHRGRLPQPPEGPRDRGHGRLPRPVVAHVALARGRRRRRQARRRDRHRLHRLPADPGARAADRARHGLQRTPQWMFGVPGYLSPSRRRCPGWIATSPTTRTSCGCACSAPASVHAHDRIDPGFADPYAVSARNKVVRDSALDSCSASRRSRVAGEMTPPHPPWSARAGWSTPDYNCSTRSSATM